MTRSYRIRKDQPIRETGGKDQQKTEKEENSIPLTLQDTEEKFRCVIIEDPNVQKGASQIQITMVRRAHPRDSVLMKRRVLHPQLTAQPDIEVVVVIAEDDLDRAEMLLTKNEMGITRLLGTEEADRWGDPVEVRAAKLNHQKNLLDNQ